MRKLCSCLLLLALVGCSEEPVAQKAAIDRGSVADQGTDPNAKPETPGSSPKTSKITPELPPLADNPAGEVPPPSVSLPSAAIDSNFISSFLSQISGSAAAGRLTGTPENKMVADLIAKEFAAAGLLPGGTGDSYFQNFTANSNVTGSVQTQNIIGVLPGKDKSQEVIVVGAHMDHLGVRNGQTYFGADDNASGTAALVAAAQAIAKSKTQLDRTLIFIAFSGEELGLLGSLHYVRNPTVPLSQIKFMLNMDMVGYSRGSLDAIGFAKTLEADTLVKDLISKSGLSPRYYATAGGGSDHMPFEQVNIPTGVFHTGVHNNYHQPTDTLPQVDQSNLGKIAGLAADFALRLARTQTISLRPLELEPPTYFEFSASLHSQGCEPGLVNFDTVAASLSELRANPPKP